jgi:hypothetical protein
MRHGAMVQLFNLESPHERFRKIESVMPNWFLPFSAARLRNMPIPLA